MAFGGCLPETLRFLCRIRRRRDLEETVKSPSWEEGKEWMGFEERGVDGAVAAISVRRGSSDFGAIPAFFLTQMLIGHGIITFLYSTA